MRERAGSVSTLTVQCLVSGVCQKLSSLGQKVTKNCFGVETNLHLFIGIILT